MKYVIILILASVIVGCSPDPMAFGNHKNIEAMVFRHTRDKKVDTLYPDASGKFTLPKGETIEFIKWIEK